MTDNLRSIEMKAKVTVGLCVKNSARIVKTAFNSICIQDYPHELMKLVIVDDSSDNTLSLAMEFAHEIDIRTFVTSCKGKGLGASRQIIVDNAEGDYIVWVDDDLVLSKDFIRNHVEFMDKNPNVGAAKYAYNDFSIQHMTDMTKLPYLIPVKELNYFGTGGAIFRLKALESVGGFDIQIKGAGEDIDVSRRIRESGWLLADNKSAGAHNKYPPATLKGLWRKNSGYGYGNYLLFCKYKDRQLIMQFFPPYTFLSGLKMAGKIYRTINMKKVFVFPILHCFGIVAQSLGFARAYLDGYGR